MMSWAINVASVPLGNLSSSILCNSMSGYFSAYRMRMASTLPRAHLAYNDLGGDQVLNVRPVVAVQGYHPRAQRVAEQRVN